MKKRGFFKFKVTLTAITLLLALAVSTLLGSTSAEYFRELSKALDFKAIPDLAMKYYLYDANHTGSGSTGVYTDSEHIEQNLSFKAASGSGVKYHIAIPVTEAGMYTLGFAVKISNASAQFTIDLNNPVGCQILSSGATNAVRDTSVTTNASTLHQTINDVTYTFGCQSAFRLSDDTRIVNYWNSSSGEAKDSGLNNTVSGKYMYQTVPFFEAKGNYQWKTVAPYYRENVELTFYASESDVTAGHVLWMWDFMGLENPTSGTVTTFTLTLDNVSWEKDYEPAADEPYVDFANMYYKNVAIMPTYYACQNIPTYIDKDGNLTGNVLTGKQPIRYYTETQGHNVAGITRECGGRGNYVTQASTSGVTLQAEPVYYGYRWNEQTIGGTTFKADQPWTDTDRKAFEDAKGLTKNTLDYSNPLVYNVPLKNIKAGVTYKLTFDFSVAKQGRNILDDRDANGDETTDNTVKADALYESDLLEFFCTENATSMLFQSYLYDRGNSATSTGPVEGFGMVKTHTTAGVRGRVSYANKSYNTHWLTSYNDVTAGGVSTTLEAALANTVVDSVNSPSWYNAVQHTENNGQNEITWLTFENTTTSFNINCSQSYETYESGEIIENLYWVWAIDSLQPSGWYRIKIDNVRLEEVIDFGANIGNSTYAGISIGTDSAASNPIESAVKTALNNGVTSPTNAKGNWRGSVGTGQNFATRKYSTLYMPLLNVYSPIYDMSDYKVKDESDYKIYLSGYCVIEGGVDRYVWSADGGETWYDMYENANSPPKAGGSDVLTGANRKINTYMCGMSTATDTSHDNYRDDFADFTAEDARKSDFRGYRIYADIFETKYKDQPNLDIIFAAVPFANSDLRCEILRITNFNAMPNYRTYTNYIKSDINVVSSTNPLDAYYGAYEKDNSREHLATFSNMSVRRLDTDAPIEPGGYARIEGKIKDYSTVRALIDNLPVKNSLRIEGWAMVDGGISGYYWSADEGKTWNACTGTIAAGTIPGDQREYYYDGSTSTNDADAVAMNATVVFSDITADLSDYEGQVVDVIFGARSKNGGPCCPVARVDNVSVYGEYGSFFTEHYVIEAGEDGTVEKWLDNNGKAINGSEQWANINREKMGSTLTEKQGYDTGKVFVRHNFTIYEPYNTNYKNMRYAFNKTVKMPSAGHVYLSGFTAFTAHPDDTSYKYKFSLDGGETWYDINQNVEVVKDATNIDLKRAKYADASYDTLVDYNATYAGKPALEFNIPSLPVGAIRELLVVVEGNNSGVRHPILRTKIEITAAEDGEISAYLARYEGDNINYIGAEKSGTVTSSGYSCDYFSLRAPTSSDIFKNTGRLRFTLPVAAAGSYTLSFNLSLGYSSGSTGTPTQNPYVASQIIRDNGENSYTYSLSQIVTYGSDSGIGSAQGTQGLDLLNIVQIENPIGSNTVSHTVAATEFDAAKGYVCWEIDLTQLDPTHGWERDADGNITASQFNNFMYSVAITGISWTAQ